MSEKIIHKKEERNSLELYRRKQFGRFLRLLIMLLVCMGILVTLFVRIQGEVTAVKFKTSEHKWLLQSLDAIAALNKDAKEAEAALPKFYDELPVALEVPSRTIPSIRQLAEAYGLTITISIGEDRVGSGDEPGGVDIRMSVRGELAALSTFLEALETGKTVVGIRGWQITRAEKQYQFSADGTIAVAPQEI